MKTRRTLLALFGLMCGTSIAGVAARPTRKHERIGLDAIVPEHFGDWSKLPEPGRVVDPGAAAIIRTIYDEVLTRTYAHKAGYRIMLSMAHGGDQRGNLAAHRPDICYPAQGFKVSMVKDGTLATAYGNIDVRRLSTSMGERHEPVTYWLTTGNRVVRTAWEKRLAQIILGLTGEIPDGLLYRVSSIDGDTDAAFDMQQRFVADMMASVDAKVRKQLSGLEPV